MHIIANTFFMYIHTCIIIIPLQSLRSTILLTLFVLYNIVRVLRHFLVKSYNYKSVKLKLFCYNHNIIMVFYITRYIRDKNF